MIFPASLRHSRPRTCRIAAMPCSSTVAALMLHIVYKPLAKQTSQDRGELARAASARERTIRIGDHMRIAAIIAAAVAALLSGWHGADAAAVDATAGAVPPRKPADGGRDRFAHPPNRGRGPRAGGDDHRADILNNGFANTADIMSSLTQNLGALDNNQYTDGFSPGAQAVDLRGLGPNHTLVLVNGRRIADYPQAYGGNSNFTDISNIPTSMIDRIEILSGSDSAIYGSDAVSGVINFIMKKKADGTTVDFRGGRDPARRRLFAAPDASPAASPTTASTRSSR